VGKARFMRPTLAARLRLVKLIRAGLWWVF
jgi:hypothetical protein